MNNNKTTDNLVQDIYDLMVSKDADPSVDVEAEIDKFGEGVKALMRTEFGRGKRKDNRKLRLSNIGRTDKYLWNHVNGTEGETIAPHTYVKFMYGHLIEEMLLFLTRMAGHSVTDEQKVDSLTVADLLQVEWRRLVDVAHKKEEKIQWSQRQAEHNAKQEQLRAQHEQQQQQPKKRRSNRTGRQPKGRAPVLEPFQRTPFTEPPPQPVQFRSIGRGGDAFEPRIEPLEREDSAEGNYALPVLGR